MRLLYSVTVVALYWFTYTSIAIPIIPGTDLRTALNTIFENDVGPSLDICDFIEILKMSSLLEFKSLQFATKDVNTNRSGKLKHYVEELLTNYFSGRQTRQAQVGYNINSFGLRFGKRASQLNLDAMWQQFDRNSQLTIPINVLHKVFCSKKL